MFDGEDKKGRGGGRGIKKSETQKTYTERLLQIM
jgi:hypothetical protein